jgi:hypothetical protein
MQVAARGTRPPRRTSHGPGRVLYRSRGSTSLGKDFSIAGTDRRRMAESLSRYGSPQFWGVTVRGVPLEVVGGYGLCWTKLRCGGGIHNRLVSHSVTSVTVPHWRRYRQASGASFLLPPPKSNVSKAIRSCKKVANIIAKFCNQPLHEHGSWCTVFLVFSGIASFLLPPPRKSKLSPPPCF